MAHSPQSARSRTSARVERIAHRGCPRERTENTLPGFLLALERGADAIELDVHVTRDAEVVVHHDAACAGRAIAESTWRELATVDLDGRGAKMSRLEDVLVAIGDRATMYIELKGQGIEDRVTSVARTHGHRFALHSFDHDAIARVRERTPDVARGVLLDAGTANAPWALQQAVETARPRDVWPHWTLVDEAFMQTARAAGVRVLAWTVNSLQTAQSLVTLGVDGVCTDDLRLLTNL